MTDNRILRNHSLFSDEGDGGENWEGKEVAVDAEDDLIYAHVESHLRYHMITPITKLHQSQRRMSLPSLSHRSRHARYNLLLALEIGSDPISKNKKKKKKKKGVAVAILV